jgi:cyclic-di-AMP phosphodiesterase PgpH
MKRFISRFPIFLRYILYVGLVLFISLFFPSGAQFEYDFSYGDRWRYNNLVAPFDFPLLKSEEELLAEKTDVALNFVPYYRLEKEALTQAQDSFRAYFSGAFSVWRDSGLVRNDGDSVRYLAFGLLFLEDVHARNLIKMEAKHSIRGDSFACMLVADNLDKGLHKRSDFIDVGQASQWLIDTLSSNLPKMPQGRLLLPLLSRCLERPNVVFDAKLTQAEQSQRAKNILLYRGMVKGGELIVAYAGVVDSLTYSKLTSLRSKYVQEINVHKSAFLIYLGYLSLTVALLMIYILFIEFYEPEVMRKLRHFGLPMMLIAIYAYLSFIINEVSFLSEYLIPFCIVPIVVLNFFSPNLALFTHIVIVLISSMLLSLDYQFILVQLIVGMVAILTKLKTRYLTDFFASIFYIGIVYTAGFISLDLIRTGAIFPIQDASGLIIEQGVRWEMLGWIGLNLFFTLLSYPLIPLFERIFGLTSEITLVELADLNKPLLKQLSICASGTLQHSLQVAHLSEAAANAINANALLVRVAALYHDIGKMKNPNYFIENQQGSNPHENMKPLDSAKIIIAHVADGIRLAQKHALPEILINFIRTHHGTTRAEYFYRQYKNEHPEDTSQDHNFSYSGPCPSSREEAILMIADSLEAASRSLSNPTATDIDNLVDNIIRGKIANAQLFNTNLSFKELETIKVIFKQLLKTIRHARIEYPKEVASKV